LEGEGVVVVQPQNRGQVHRTAVLNKPSACEGKAFKIATPYVNKTMDGDKKPKEERTMKTEACQSTRSSSNGTNVRRQQLIKSETIMVPCNEGASLLRNN
jgi:hypothetical protein